jgi:hypothetical protein
MNRDDITAHLIGLAKIFSGAEKPRLDDRVYADLGISGGDAVEFYDRIEKEFGIDIRAVTETSVEVKPGWFQKARRKSVARDPSLAELCAFVESKSCGDMELR